jgi:2-polyprenyl-3-methyl-5-hydroxy-6-metoxy-1,4-benzoquinol methylase
MIKHRYEHQIDPNGGSAAARLARMVRPGQRVLELGTGPGTVTRILHEKGCRVTGVELDASAAALCAPYCERMVQGDLEDADWQSQLQAQRFDAVICADVLEHLRDPRALLKTLPAFLEPEGCILISLPNAGHLSVVASLLAGRFAYQDKGLLDSTHLRFFGREDIERMLAECGLLWLQWETVEVPPESSELQHFWHRLTAQEQDLLRSRGREGLVYQHVIRVCPAQETAMVQRLAVLMDQLQQQQTLQAQSELALASCEREKNALLQELDQREHNTTLLQHSINALQQTRNELQQTLNALLSSHSWRITQPLRDIGRWLRGLL